MLDPVPPASAPSFGAFCVAIIVLAVVMIIESLTREPRSFWLLIGRSWLEGARMRPWSTKIGRCPAPIFWRRYEAARGAFLAGQRLRMRIGFYGIPRPWR
jgi:hypothetical protein